MKKWKVSKEWYREWRITEFLCDDESDGKCNNKATVSVHMNKDYWVEQDDFLYVELTCDKHISALGEPKIYNRNKGVK